MKKIFVALLLLLATGCSNSGSISTEQSFVSGNGISTYIKPDARQPAPDLAGATLDGTKLVSSPSQVRVVNVWASWCSPCRAEAPALEELSKSFADVQFIGVLTRDNLVSARAFVSRFGITYPTLIDDAILAKFPSALLPNAIPTTLIIDKKGKVAVRISGEITYSGLKDLISKVSSE